MAILSEPNGYFWHIACITKVHEGKSKEKNSEERSKPMKVKTNTKAGSALWGS
jgi:hypothetical protein